MNPNRRSRSLSRSNSNLYRTSIRSASQTPNKFLQTPSTRPSRNARESENRRSVKKLDTRPIQNKTWQANEAGKIEKFLRDIGAKSFLNNGQKLRPLTLTNFVQITNILLQPLIAGVSLNTANYVEKLPIYLKLLEYNGTISASNLKTAYTLHSWPSIVAVLSFLVNLQEEVLSEDSLETSRVDDLENAEFDRLNLKQKLKNFHIQNAFKAYFSEQGPERSDKVIACVCEGYIEDLAELYGLKGSPQEIKTKVDTKIEKCRKEQHELLQERQKIENAVQAEVKKVVTKKTKLKELREKVAKIPDGARELKEEIINVQKSCQNLRNECKTLQEKYGTVTCSQDLAKIRKNISDTQRKLDEKKEVKASLEENKNHLEELSDSSDLRLTRLKAKLRKNVIENNAKIYEYTLKYPELEQCLHPEKQDMKALSLETEHFRQINEKSKELIKKCLETIAKLKEDKKRLQDEIQEETETLIRKEKQYFDVEKICLKKKIDLRELKLKMQENENELLAEINNLEIEYANESEKISRKENLLKDTIKKVNEECTSLTKMQEDLQNEMKKGCDHLQTLHEYYNQLVEDSIEIMQGYIDYELKELSVVRKYVTEQTENMEEVKVVEKKEDGGKKKRVKK